MATAAATAEYIEDADFAREEITARGHRICIGIKPESANGLSPPGEFLEIGSAHALPIPFSENFEDDIRADDVFFFVTDEFDFDVRQADMPEGDYFTVINEREYRIYRAQALRFDNQTLIMTEIQCRH